MRILLVGSDPITELAIRYILNLEGYSSQNTSLGAGREKFGMFQDYDAIILDTTEHIAGAHSYLAGLRRARIDVPVLLLSDEQDDDIKISGFSAGADDYMIKPFNSSEFVARIRTLVRRFRGHSSPTIEIGRMKVNLHAHTVEIDGRHIEPTDKEYRILELLSMRKGENVSKKTITEHLYAELNQPVQSIIDVFVCNLRKKIASAADGANFIETVWGFGYRLRDPSETRRTENTDKMTA